MESNVLCSAEFSIVESIIEYIALYSFVLCSAEFSTVGSIVVYIALYSFVLCSGKYGIVPGAWALHGDSTVLYSTVEGIVQYSTGESTVQ